LRINTQPVEAKTFSASVALTTIGTVIAVLFAVPALFIGIFGIIKVVSGDSYLGGLVSAIWGYATVVGAYELNRSKFDWDRGRSYDNLHLGTGMVAVSVAMVGSAALENLLFVFAVFPGIAGVLHARRRFSKNYTAAIYTLMLVTSFTTAIWLYSNEFQARQLVAAIEALP
jgi:hypothetical protein